MFYEAKSYLLCCVDSMEDRLPIKRKNLYFFSKEYTMRVGVKIVYVAEVISDGNE